MVKMYVPSGELTWEEKLDIRKHALECASRTYQNSTPVADVVMLRAKMFEDYLLGNWGNQRNWENKDG
jgi:hypothetical protein